MNKLYLKDKLQMAYETYDAFEKFCRPEKMSIKEYINEFEHLLRILTGKKHPKIKLQRLRKIRI